MKIIFDSEELLKFEYYDTLGEFLRMKCFIPKDKYGCYSTFKLESNFGKIEFNSELGKKLLKFLYDSKTKYESNSDEYLEIYTLENFIDDYKPSLYSNGEINIAWYWDGDGTLLFNTDEFTIINRDCKKSYGWFLIK